MKISKYTIKLVFLAAVLSFNSSWLLAQNDNDLPMYVNEQGVVVYPINETSDLIEYPFGYAEPIVTASPLRISRIELEKGEEVVGQAIGDSHRWQIDYTLQGEGETSKVIFLVKPIIDNITTNFVITTNRRVYDITLDAPKLNDDSTNPNVQFTRGISFYYPAEKTSSLHLRLQQEQKERRKAIEKQTRIEIPEAVNERFEWEKRRDFPWEPVAVWDNGKQVYIQLPDDFNVDAHELPGVFLTNRFGDKQQMNFTYDPDQKIIKTDRVFREAKLTYQFEKRRWHGIGRTTRDRVLHITLNNS